MKKIIIALVALSAAVSVLAQGTVLFNTASTANGVNMRVYAPEVGNPTLSQTGNTSAQLPAGTKTYTGALLEGSRYMAQLYAANGVVVTDTSLQAALPITTFRTGSAAGVVAGGATATLAGVPLDAASATIQLRVWDNQSGNYATWAAAETAWNAGTIAAGKSPLLNVTAIGGTLNAPPYLAGLQSFNIYSKAAVPEPTSFALLGLGALGMLIFRRK
jgi:hypothetical protein